MEKKSKAEIKKMIAELHGKPVNGKGKNQPMEQAAGAKTSKSASHSKTYRPKI